MQRAQEVVAAAVSRHRLKSRGFQPLTLWVSCMNPLDPHCSAQVAVKKTRAELLLFCCAHQKLTFWLHSRNTLFASYMSIILWLNYLSQQLISLLPQTYFKWTGMFINHLPSSSSAGLINTWKSYLDTFLLERKKGGKSVHRQNSRRESRENFKDRHWCYSVLGLCKSLRKKD